MNKEYNNQVKWIAHRGYSWLLTENTKEAFILAGKHEFYGIETDIHITKDDVIVCHHDESTKRITGIDLMIRDTNFNELSKLGLITMLDYIDICIKYNMHAVIEIKPIFTSYQIEKTINEVVSKNFLDNCTFISFYPENLELIKKLNPNIKVQFLTNKLYPDLIKKAKELDFGLDLHYKLITKELVEEILDNDIELNVWTVNNEEMKKELINLGVTMITTDLL